MLGDKLYQISGQVTGRRILAHTIPGQVKIEVSFAGTGSVLGVDTVETGTYEATIKGPGVLLADGQGLSVTADGEAVTWSGFAVGHPTGKGMAAEWRGSIHYVTNSVKLARLNQTAVVFEWSVAEDGTANGTTWEWK